MEYKYKAIGWTRHGDSKGAVSKYHFKDVCNCITTFCGGNGYKDPVTKMCNTTPYVLITYGDTIKF